ncbi:MAG: hypothetical protein LUF83_10915 [Alistipes sp.]|nr:hypothetical protein [Alistipes sp.]
MFGRLLYTKIFVAAFSAAALLSPAPLGAQGFDRHTPPEFPDYDLAPFLYEGVADSAGVVTTASGLRYVVLDTGDTTLPRATESDRVVIWQRNAWKDDSGAWVWKSGFNRSSDYVNTYIRFYREGLQLMHPGAHFIFHIPATEDGPSERFIETCMIAVGEDAGADEEDDTDCGCDTDDEEEGDDFDETGFFLRNALVKGVVTLAPGLQYKVLEKGRGAVIAADDEVYVNFATTPLARYTEFEPGQGDFIRAEGALSEYLPGIEKGLQQMRPGSRYVFWMGRDWSGSRGKGLIFEVEVLCVYRNDGKDD